MYSILTTRSAITPASSEHVDGISSPERKHREALEYAEDDEPEQVVEEEVLEASAQIPNIPVPRTSDGNVSTRPPAEILPDMAEL